MNTRTNALREKAVNRHQLIWKPKKHGETIAGEFVELGTDSHPLYGSQFYLAIKESDHQRVILPSYLYYRLRDESLAIGDLIALTYEGKCKISGLSQIESFSYILDKGA